jgi:hypothetical protein
MAVEARKGCKFVRVADESACRRVGMVQLKQHFPTRAHRALLEHLRESVRAPRQMAAGD